MGNTNTRIEKSEFGIPTLLGAITDHNISHVILHNLILARISILQSDQSVFTLCLHSSLSLFFISPATIVKVFTFCGDHQEIHSQYVALELLPP